MQYEQLEVWKRSFFLSVRVYQLFSESRDYGFKDQICRSGLSVPSNIADQSAGATFERCVVYIGLEEVRDKDVPNKDWSESQIKKSLDFYLLLKALLVN